MGETAQAQRNREHREIDAIQRGINTYIANQLCAWWNNPVVVEQMIAISRNRDRLAECIRYEMTKTHRIVDRHPPKRRKPMPKGDK
jgi:hypothetical protein